MARPPLAERKRAERAAARARIQARTTTGLSDEQRAWDPQDHRSTPAERAVAAVASLGGSTAVHAAIIGLGFLLGGMGLVDRKDRSTATKIEMRERIPEKKPEPPPPPPPPPVPDPSPVVRRPSPAAVPPPPDLPPEPEKKPPPRVVGLNFEATSEAGGGGGPSFNVGNTREGKTDKVAVDPKKVAPVAPPPDPAPVVGNTTATRIPVAGAKYVLPKRKKPSVPAYPETLKSQGIEADVTVLVTLDVNGKVTAVKVIKKAPYPEFDEAARQAALAEEFEPATKDGVAVPYSLSFTYRFRLEDQ